MIERHYFKENLLKSFDFKFGFIIPGSTNTVEHIYELPQLTNGQSNLFMYIVNECFSWRNDKCTLWNLFGQFLFHKRSISHAHKSFLCLHKLNTVVPVMAMYQYFNANSFQNCNSARNLWSIKKLYSFDSPLVVCLLSRISPQVNLHYFSGISNVPTLKIKCKYISCN